MSREDALRSLVAAGGVVVLSGAGISTASGIPDYRGPTGRTRTAPPMRWQDFAGDETSRRRYWARGQVGFRRYAGVRPNVAHDAVAELEQLGVVDAVVTQNVDGLHQQAGTRSIVELHGSLAEVLCMGCDGREPRAAFARRLGERNPWVDGLDGAPQADGDALLDDGLVRRFEVLGCQRCGGVMRPDVVFFGELVPRLRMERARDLVAGARVMLVVGSSLSVGSGRLLVRHGLRNGAQLAIVNSGPTTADEQASVRLDADVTQVLPALVASARGAASM